MSMVIHHHIAKFPQFSKKDLGVLNITSKVYNEGVDGYFELKAELEDLRRWCTWLEIRAQGNDFLMAKIEERKIRLREMEEKLEFLRILVLVFLGD